MRNYTGEKQIAAFGCDPCDNVSIFSTFEIDWVAVSLVCSVAGWVTYQYYQPQNESLSNAIEPLLHTATAVARRLAIDLARFLFTILGIVAELLLEGTYAWARLLHRFQCWINKIFDRWRPAIQDKLIEVDAAYHSHQVNLARQRLRAFSKLFVKALGWGLLVRIMWVCLRSRSVDNGNDLANLDVRQYVIPSWVIKARPENRPHDGSSSHYRSGDYYALIKGYRPQKSYNNLRHLDIAGFTQLESLAP